ncbi:hypothetical protein pf16_171 [Pseudomonas phage pf16]|uniref:Uncharacterized protein n=1 Tax=Pseudomonas phage pf16 TaxID=1815630 RepID=A0A1S5R444_9CAUD|nr:hypothetical protein FDG98_gp127 [Pseudomonas phage pf16]AND75094.1 hypothetical protein pf16_171 [Pseudomonas phage pf16]
MIVKINEDRFNELLLQGIVKRRRVGSFEFTEVLKQNKIVAMAIGDVLLEQQ